ncbi:MAG: SMP-30/gluconolactonase/LRE family protein, partial [Woeseia sp.]
MKKPAVLLLVLVALVLLYLLLWPVPVSPVAWQAPRDSGLTDPFEPNDVLGLATPIGIGDYHGPEDIAGDPDGYLYASTLTGHIIRFRADGSDLNLFADVGGRPLGLEFDGQGNLYVANAPLGLQRVGPDGSVESLASEFEGEPIAYA